MGGRWGQEVAGEGKAREMAQPGKGKRRTEMGQRGVASKVAPGRLGGEQGVLDWPATRVLASSPCPLSCLDTAVSGLG